MTEIKTCTCAHGFQDKKYGKGNRVHNSVVPKNGKWRCTVCGKIKS